MSEPTIDEIMAMIAKHGSVTAEPLRDLIVTVVLEAVEAEREACARLCETEFCGDDVSYYVATAIRARGKE